MTAAASDTRNFLPAGKCLSLFFGVPDVPEARAELDAAIRDGLVPWDRFLCDAAAPYFFDRLKKAGLASDLPPDVRARFKRLLIEQTGRNIVMLRELAAAAAALNSRGIEPVLLKGAALMKTVYEHPGLRRLADLDLRVRKNETTSATDALRSIGYSPAGVRGHHINFTAQREFPVLIELHTHLFNPGNPLHRLAFPIDVESFAGRSLPLEQDGPRVRVPSPEDMVIHLVCHAVKERFGSLKYFADIYELQEKNIIDWERASGLFEKYKLKKAENSLVYILKITNKYEIINSLTLAPASRAGWQFDSPPTAGGWGGRISEAIFYFDKIEGLGRKLEALLLLPVYMARRGRAADV
jgi:hypothetical protein